MDKISIVIPMYNSKDTIIRCLDSITNNTKSFYEIIVVDDGSIDNSSIVVNEFIKAHRENNIKLYKKNNGGVSSARNLGIEKATGNYVWFIDSDDEIKIDAFEQLEKDKFYLYDIYKFNYICEKLGGRIQLKAKKPLKKIKDNFIKKYYLNSPCTQLYSLDLIRKYSIRFKENINYGEDFLFNLDMYSKTNNIYISNRYLYFYKQTSISLTRMNNNSKLTKKIDDVFNTYGRLYEYTDIYNFKSKDINKRIKKEIIEVLKTTDNINIFNEIINYKNVKATLNMNKTRLNFLFKTNCFKQKIKNKIKILLKSKY